MKKVYLASPFFNETEVEIMENVLAILREKGLEVFAPYENQNKHLEFGSLAWREATFNSDVNGIDSADFMVAINCAGNYDDTGTAWEIGYAYAKGIPVIVVNTTGKTINLMIADSLRTILTSYDEIREYDFETLPIKPYTEYVW